VTGFFYDGARFNKEGSFVMARIYHRVLAALAGLILLAMPVQAQQNEIRSVITSQIEAFQSDDFVTAFGFAAPQIQQYFRTPERFEHMVRSGYPMVYRPHSIEFQELQTEVGTGVQYILIEAQDGGLFVAEYSMLLTGEGWRIAGVRVVKSPGVKI
jgi:hypothetical protein